MGMEYRARVCGGVGWLRVGLHGWGGRRAASSHVMREERPTSAEMLFDGVMSLTTF